MDQTLEYKMDMLKKALMTLEEALSAHAKNARDMFIRDAVIQRFEYSFELCRKACKVFLLDRFGTSAPSPKECFRALRVHGLVADDETEILLQMVDDRNKTTHAYDETFARELVARIKDYHSLMQRVFAHISEEKEKPV